MDRIRGIVMDDIEILLFILFYIINYFIFNLSLDFIISILKSVVTVTLADVL